MKLGSLQLKLRSIPEGIPIYFLYYIVFFLGCFIVNLKSSSIDESLMINIPDGEVARDNATYKSATDIDFVKYIKKMCCDLQ
jgi:hypothetical protein